MTTEQYDKLIKVCDDVSADVKRDAGNFDGQPFTGKVMGAYMGYHGAAIDTLSNVLKLLIEDLRSKEIIK